MTQMYKFNCKFCNNPIEVEEEWFGQYSICPHCNKEIIVPDLKNNTKLTFQNSNSRNGSPIKEYKVLTQKDKWFSEKFDPYRLEAAINSYAQQGWRVISCTTATFPSLLGDHREEIIILLERDK